MQVFVHGIHRALDPGDATNVMWPGDWKGIHTGTRLPWAGNAANTFQWVSVEGVVFQFSAGSTSAPTIEQVVGEDGLRMTFDHPLTITFPGGVEGMNVDVRYQHPKGPNASAKQLADTVAAVTVESRGGVSAPDTIPSTQGDDWVPYCFHGAGMVRFVIQPHVPGKPALAPLPMSLRNVQRATA